jgi:predicted alpha/beta superfamily hydrolase
MTELLIRVPPETPTDAQVFIAGDAPELGPWRACGMPLVRRSEDTFAAEIAVPSGRRLNYLITRGSWRLVESLVGGLERGPRWLTPTTRMSSITVADWGRHSIRYHHRFFSEQLKNQRTISVYVPPGYDRDRTRRFPVFYLHDGQNLFDAATAFGGVTWEADETADRLIRAKTVLPIILVGIANTQQRLHEYGPTGRRSRGTSRSYRYGKFLVEELKPFIDRTYRSLTGPMTTAVGGSSMGGLISLFLTQWYPETFGQCMAMSPSLWWDRELIHRNWPDDPAWLRDHRFWIDTGTEEGGSATAKRQQLRRVRRLALALDSGGLSEGSGCRYSEIQDGQHSERDWAARFGQVLEYFFGGPACSAS